MITKPSQKRVQMTERGQEELFNDVHKNVNGEINYEELVDCIDNDEDDETVMDLVEDVFEWRVGTAEKEGESSEGFPKKQLFKTIRIVFHKIIKISSCDKKKNVFVPRETSEEKGKEKYLSNHLKAEVAAPTCNQPPGRFWSCNIVLNTPGLVEEILRTVHSESDMWKLVNYRNR